MKRQVIIDGVRPSESCQMKKLTGISGLGHATSGSKCRDVDLVDSVKGYYQNVLIRSLLLCSVGLTSLNVRLSLWFSQFCKLSFIPNRCDRCYS